MENDHIEWLKIHEITKKTQPNKKKAKNKQSVQVIQSD